MTGKWIISALATTIALFSTTITTAEEPKAKSGPTIQVDAKEKDLGEVWAGDPLETSFKITNVGNETLKIEDVKEKCDCTVAGEYPKSLEPGESGILPFTLDTTEIAGSFKRKVVVVSNDSETPKYELKLSGKSKPHYQLSPKSKKINFLVPEGQTPKPRVFKITNVSPKPLEIEIDASSKPGDFDYQLMQTKAGQEFQVLVSPRAPFEPGKAKRGTLAFKMNTGSKKPVVLGLSSRTPTRIEVQPRLIPIISGVKRTKGTVRKLRVRNYGKTPANVLTATVDDPALKIESIKKEEKTRSFLLTLKIPPKYQPPDDGRTLTIKTDDSEFSTLKVPIRKAVLRKSKKPRIRPAELMVGKAAPSFTVETTDGITLSNQDLNEGITIFNFVALNCPYCKKQLPKVESVRGRVRRKRDSICYGDANDEKEVLQRRRYDGLS